MMQSTIDAVVQWATALIGDWGLPAVGWLGIRMGEHWEDIRAYLHNADYVVTAAMVAVIVWALLRWRKKLRHGGPGPEEYGDEA